MDVYCTVCTCISMKATWRYAQSAALARDSNHVDVWLRSFGEEWWHLRAYRHIRAYLQAEIHDRKIGISLNADPNP